MNWIRVAAGTWKLGSACGSRAIRVVESNKYIFLQAQFEKSYAEVRVPVTDCVNGWDFLPCKELKSFPLDFFSTAYVWW